MTRPVVYIFGNPDYTPDALPVKLLPLLAKTLPAISFVLIDPNEEIAITDGSVTVIDTVVGIDRVTVYTDLASFQPTPRLTAHNFDALAQLRHLQKIGKLKEIKIIGLPAQISETEIVAEIARNL